jgi:CRP-like cAMP-binding protein
MSTPRARTLQSLSIFAGLSSKDREVIASNLDEVSYGQGATLVRQGDNNHAFFVIVEGEVTVSVSGETRRTLGPGSFFGEISMRYRIPATATVVTTTPVRAYVMSHAQFGVLQATPTVIARLEAAMNDRLISDRQVPSEGSATR